MQFSKFSKRRRKIGDQKRPLLKAMKAVFNNLTSETGRRAKQEYSPGSANHCKANSIEVSVKSVRLSTQMHVTDWAEAQHENPVVKAAMDWCHLNKKKSEIGKAQVQARAQEEYSRGKENTA